MSDTMTNIKKSKNLFSDSKKLASIKQRHLEETQKSNIDKHGIGFNSDSRFCVFSAKVTFSAHTGSYGSSSCGTFERLSSGDVGGALIEYLSENEDEVLKRMAEILALKAKSLVDSARAEVKRFSDDLDSIEGY
jgi:hypothetical protein